MNPALVLSLALLSTAPDRSVVVLDMEVAGGTDPQVARAMTDLVLEEVQRSGVFSRVLGSREVQAVLGLEQQRQLLSCSDTGCMAELVGALGVDYVITMSMTRLGTAHLLQLKLVDARKVSLAAAATIERSGGDAPHLDMARDGVARLLAPLQGPRPGGAEPVTWVRRGVGLTGGSLAGVSLLLVPAGVALVAAGGVGLVLPRFLYVPTPGLPGDMRVVVLPAAGAASAVAGLVTGLVALVLVSVGLGTLLAAWLLGVP
jgi:hypothetical protein